MMIGDHFIKAWSRTQNNVTLSSAEAELVAMCKLSAEMLGLLSLARDLGREMRGVVYADSSAALAITQRRGSGKLRHINVGLLWVQEKEENKELEYIKVPGTRNPADLMTKHVPAVKIEQYTKHLAQEWKTGRAGEGLRVQSGQVGSEHAVIAQVSETSRSSRSRQLLVGTLLVRRSV